MMCHICGNAAVICDRLMALDWRGWGKKGEWRAGGRERCRELKCVLLRLETQHLVRSCENEPNG